MIHSNVRVSPPQWRCRQSASGYAALCAAETNSSEESTRRLRPNLDLYSGKQVDGTYLGDKLASLAAVATAEKATAQGKLTTAQQIDAGSVLFKGTCSTCHQESGQGLASVFPPLAKSDYLLQDPKRAIGIVLNGFSGPLTVNASTYNSVMPPMSHLNDDEVANILTYVLNHWGNQGPAITAAQVTEMRATTQRPQGAAR